MRVNSLSTAPAPLKMLPTLGDTAAALQGDGGALVGAGVGAFGIAGTSGIRGPLGDVGALKFPSDGTGSGGSPSDMPPGAAGADVTWPNDGGATGGGVSDAGGGSVGSGGAKSASGMASLGLTTSGASDGTERIAGGVSAGAGVPPVGESRWKS